MENIILLRKRAKKAIKKLELNAKFNQVFNLLAPVSIFLVTIVISGYFSTIGADPHHDGMLAKPAMDVASGRMLFRDTFTLYGALTTIIQAASLNIFGKYLITLKFTTVFFYGLISILLYLILKKILPKLMVFICLIIWILLAPYYEWTFLIWPSVYALFFQLLGAWLLLISFEKKSKNLIFLGGVSTALVFWCRQPVGIFMFLAIVTFYIYLYLLKKIGTKELKECLFNYIIGNILVNAIFIIWLAANHAFIDWWKQSILYPFFWAQHGSGGLTNFIRAPFPRSINPAISIWSLLPIATICVLIRNSKNQIISLLAFVGLASWLQYYPIACIRHLYWGGTPMLGLCALFIYQIVNDFLVNNSKIPKNIIKYLTIIIFVIIFLPDAGYRMVKGLKKINRRYYFVDHPAFLKNIRLTKDEANFYVNTYQKIEKYFNDNPNGNVITNGVNALCLTFDDRIKNFHPMYINSVLVNESIYRDYPNQLNRYVETNKPLEI